MEIRLWKIVAAPAPAGYACIAAVALSLISIAGYASLPAAGATGQPEATLSAAEQELQIEKGIVLSELGDLQAAMAEFGAVLAVAPDHAEALYEAAMTRYSLHEYAECASLAKRGAQLQSAYQARFELILGNALDELGDTPDAIAAYRRSIGIDASNYLAHFNLAVTLARSNDTDGARSSVQAGLRVQPYHASSHLLLARLYHFDGFRVPAILAYARFLPLEANSTRSAEAADALHALLDANTDSLPIALAQARAENSEGNFQPVEQALALLQSFQEASTMTAATEAARIADRFELLFGLLSEYQPDPGTAGFAWEFYAPYFAAIEHQDFTVPLSYFTLRAHAIPEVDTWLDDNHGKVNQFLAWSAEWRWQ